MAPSRTDVASEADLINMNELDKKDAAQQASAISALQETLNMLTVKTDEAAAFKAELEALKAVMQMDGNTVKDLKRSQVRGGWEDKGAGRCVWGGGRG